MTVKRRGGNQPDDDDGGAEKGNLISREECTPSLRGNVTSGPQILVAPKYAM